jgi:hypothetical protein
LLADERVTRVAWRGGEDAAERLLRLLPGRDARAEGRPQRGWQREVAQFLARACERLGDSAPAGAAIAAFPGEGVLGETAAAWMRRGGDASAGARWLLADLVAARHGEARPAQLLQRVACGGLLAAVVPAPWLEGAEFAPAREAWLQQAVLRLAARLPQPVTEGHTPEAAVIVLERNGRPGRAAAAFEPQRDRMGRFHLRRYLQEVLASLGRG